ncbi:hypothetical protein K438DRAFT_1779240 [Mycena galopus ATCC 62051]|nr:hypothetical protein K438DRAFT_1779240 [Mycena galopus ATCC 62051]
MSGDSDLFSLCSLHFAIYGPFAATAVGSAASVYRAHGAESARRNRIFSKLSTRRQPPLTVSVDARLYFANGVLKFGRSNRPPRRKAEWQRQCCGEDQDWMDFYWEILMQKSSPRAPRKIRSTQMRGKAGLVRIVEARLTALGWSWKRSHFYCISVTSMYQGATPSTALRSQP